jgi:endonuclease/exonuclease/phosphatase family metal-dependent hydrolase
MRRRLRNIGLILLGLVVLFAAYRVLGVYQFRSGECHAVAPRKFTSTYPKHLRVMTFNIEGHATFLKGDAHIRAIAETIRKYQPDVVAINEAHRYTWQARFGDHVEQLRRLTGMNGAFGRSYAFMGGAFGNAVLTRGTIVSVQVHNLPGTGEPRSLMETQVAVNGGLIEVYVTHTAAWASINQSIRGEQLQCVNAHLRAAGHPFILMGDLNAAPTSPEIARFLNTNVTKFAGDAKEPTHKVMNERLDYILADPGWTIVSSRVIDEGPSDHRPVIAELSHL